MLFEYHLGRTSMIRHLAFLEHKESCRCCNGYHAQKYKKGKYLSNILRNSGFRVNIETSLLTDLVKSLKGIKGIGELCRNTTRHTKIRL